MGSLGMLGGTLGFACYFCNYFCSLTNQNKLSQLFPEELQALQE